jgi:hypothetical protein
VARDSRFVLCLGACRWDWMSSLLWQSGAGPAEAHIFQSTRRAYAAGLWMVHCCIRPQVRARHLEKPLRDEDCRVWGKFVTAMTWPKKFGRLILTASLPLLFSGCFMHTVVGNGNGAESPDRSLTMRVECHGASRKAYVDMTKKRVFIFIWRKPPSYMSKWEGLFSGKYVFTGADLCWHVQWQSPREATVDFYDFGDRMDRDDARKAGAPSNHIASLAFVLDSKSGKFVEKK